MRFAHVRLTTLLTALVCFTLPWFQVSCHGPDGTEVIISQSGFEAAIGETTTLVNGQFAEANPQAPEQFREPPKAAWLLAVFGSAILLAILASLLIKSGNARWLTATLFSGLAAGTLIVQIAMGFPLLKDAPDDSTEFTLWFWLAVAASILAPVASLCERVRLSSSDSTDKDRSPEHLAWDDPRDAF